MRIHRLFLSVLAFVLISVLPSKAQDLLVQTPQVVLERIPFPVVLASVGADSLGPQAYSIAGMGEPVSFAFDEDEGQWIAQDVTVPETGRQDLTIYRAGEALLTQEVRSVSGWWAIIPPMLAIAIALISKRVIPALFLGLWIGAFTIQGFSLKGIFMGLLDTFQVYVLQAFIDPNHAPIILFSLMIGGMVGIISRNGGMQGVVNHIVKWASTPKRGQAATGALGLAIFFDDYANSLVVGNTMRPVTDRLRVSREKLAYIVDSTAAPVACIALVTTWIGYEVGLIGTSVAKIDGLDGSAFSFFLSSIPYSFYPILAIFFVFLVALWGKDFGPMYRAERRARETGQVMREGAAVDESASGEESQPKPGIPHRAINAVIPVLVLVFGVLAGLYATGEGDSLREIINSSDSYTSLMWASLMGVFVAVILTASQRLMNIGEIVEAWYAGLKSMLFAMIILVLAWALSEITQDLHTAPYLVSILGDAVPPSIIPAVVFLLSAATAFATGSSWGTMGILMPLVLPLAWAVMMINGMVEAHDYHILYSTISCILAGAVWGDHCSPISDTTILSSMASGCDHIDHVNTQLPYALLVGMVALIIGTIPAGFGAPWWVPYPIGMTILVLFLKFFGKNAEEGLPTYDSTNT
ncbi:MAG: Na+/H+ antiporter NhaC family protein [Bacteroidetes bacterium]|nr:Na+/H+ antiporter NhaC family protein [Bacteroidota bacterium]